MKIAIVTIDNRTHFLRYSDREPYFGTAPSALLEGLAGIPECEVHIICCTKKLLRSPERLAENIFYHSLMVPRWGWTRGFFVGCVLAVRRKLREIMPDLVHGQGTERECGLAAVFSGFPSILTVHGIMRRVAIVNNSKPLSFLWWSGRLESMTLPRALGVLCNSSHAVSQVSGLARKTWLVPNALQSVFFSPPTADSASVLPVLLNIGVVTLNKRQIPILGVARHLHKRGAQFQMQFIGTLESSTPYGRQFQSEIEMAERAGYGKYLGHKSPAELIKIMDSSSALVHAPMEESFGLVVAEGLARNLKLFGTRTGGVVDIARGVNGAELYEVGDFDGLEAGIDRWLTAGAPKPGDARRQMEARYHPRIIARRHLEIYDEVISKTERRNTRFASAHKTR